MIQLPEMVSFVHGRPKIVWQDTWSLRVGKTQVMLDAPHKELLVLLSSLSSSSQCLTLAVVSCHSLKSEACVP